MVDFEKILKEEIEKIKTEQIYSNPSYKQYGGFSAQWIDPVPLFKKVYQEAFNDLQSDTIRYGVGELSIKEKGKT